MKKYKIFLLEYLTYAGLIVTINMIWGILEIIFDGGIQPSISDTIIGLAFAYHLKNSIFKFNY